jgi:hypothetical protein
MTIVNPVSITHAAAPDTLMIRTPYHIVMSRLFSALGGDWIACRQTWLVDASHEGLIRDMCRDVFGTDGDDDPEFVDVRLHILADIEAERGGVFLSGREIASIRTSGAVRLGNGVSLLAGPAPGRLPVLGRWATRVPAGAVLRVRNVPLPAVMSLIAESREDVVVGIVGQPPADRGALLARRADLERRLAVVDVLLAECDAETGNVA